MAGDGKAYFAKRLKDEGNALFQGGDYEGAIAKFSEVWRAVPAAAPPRLTRGAAGNQDSAGQSHFVQQPLRGVYGGEKV